MTALVSHPDAELIRLCGEYVAHMEARNAAWEAAEGDDEARLRLARAGVAARLGDELEPHRQALRRAAAIPATTPEGEAAKARAVRCWLCECGAGTEWVARRDPEVGVAWSLANDLLGRAGA